MIKHQKPKSFYDTFERKGPGQKVTHYCPGCGHGTIHKLIAEALDELEVQDNTVFCSPVGCSVFAYYYFDTGNVQCSHGRAPAVASGIRRCLDDAVVISYQGDGDLAGIGTTEIIHAANRGENITVFFVNNAIYGMTGGQMAPTTLLGQKTQTTPTGRSLARDGAPIGMAEIMDAIKAPVFVERTSLATTPQILKTKKIIKKAIQNQVEKKGFSFVEILAPCPINWKMEPSDARKWLKEHLEPIFPVKNFRDHSSEIQSEQEDLQTDALTDSELVNLFQLDSSVSFETKAKSIKDQFIKISGFGGQGVMSAGVLLASCAIAEGLNATWLPSYGPEMRGGTANASVILSNGNIGTPLVDYPNVLMAMNIPSLDAFEESVQPGGMILVNSSIIPRKVQRDDVKTIYVPATELATQGGLLAGANVIMLTVYILASEIIDIETFRKVLPLNIKRKKYVESNMNLLERAIEFYEKNR